MKKQKTQKMTQKQNKTKKLKKIKSNWRKEQNNSEPHNLDRNQKHPTLLRWLMTKIMIHYSRSHFESGDVMVYWSSWGLLCSHCSTGRSKVSCSTVSLLGGHFSRVSYSSSIQWSRTQWQNETLFWGESSTSQIYKDWWVWSLWGCSINYLKITVSFGCDSQIPSSFLNCINKWSELLRVGRKKATGQIIYSATVVKKQSVRTCYEKIQCEEACKHLLPWIQSGNKVLTVLAVASALDSSHRTNAVFATAVPTRGGGLSISTLKCI